MISERTNRGGLGRADEDVYAIPRELPGPSGKFCACPKS